MAAVGGRQRVVARSLESESRLRAVSAITGGDGGFVVTLHAGVRWRASDYEVTRRGSVTA